MFYQPVTIVDIAQKLEISVSAVSKALRDHSDMSRDTIKIVRTTAEEMGYTPNLIARGLSARKSNIIGVVIPQIAHTFFSDILEVIYRIAFEKNYSVILTVSRENAEREKKQIQTLMSMKVDGIIMSITQETVDYNIFEIVKEQGLPIVFIDRIPCMENINIVRVCDKEGAFKAVEHAIKIGYKRIGHIAGYEELNIGKLRYEGFAEAMNAYGVTINPNWIIRGGLGEIDGYNSFMDLYNSGNLPDIIFCVSYPVALGVYQAAHELKINIPNDVDIICFGNAEIQKFLNPPLSCINQPTNLIAQKSMEILFANINNPESFTPREEVLPVDLIVRDTCYKRL